jgi:hypothetical protein
MYRAAAPGLVTAMTSLQMPIPEALSRRSLLARVPWPNKYPAKVKKLPLIREAPLNRHTLVGAFAAQILIAAHFKPIRVGPHLAISVGSGINGVG